MTEIVLVACVILFVVELETHFLQRRARLLRARFELNQKGYTWIQWNDLLRLVDVHGSKLKRLPPYNISEFYNRERADYRGVLESLDIRLSHMPAVIGLQISFGSMAAILALSVLGVATPVVVLAPMGYQSTAIVGVALVYGVLIGWIAYRSSQTFRALRERGYRWVGVEESFVLYVLTGRGANRLPPIDQANLIPGFREYDMRCVRGLIDCARSGKEFQSSYMK